MNWDDRDIEVLGSSGAGMAVVFENLAIKGGKATGGGVIGGTAALGGLAAVVCIAVECSQLYHAPWIDAARRTWFGRLALGDTFAWGDIAAYLVRIGSGGVAEWAVCRARQDRRPLNCGLR